MNAIETGLLEGKRMTMQDIRDALFAIETATSESELALSINQMKVAVDSLQTIQRAINALGWETAAREEK